MNYVWNRQAERWDSDLKQIAVVTLEFVMAFHCPHSGFKHRSAGIAKRLSRVLPRLFANDTGPVDFFFFSIAVRNQPIAVEQLRRAGAMVRYGDRVGEKIAIC